MFDAPSSFRFGGWEDGEGGTAHNDDGSAGSNPMDTSGGNAKDDVVDALAAEIECIRLALGRITDKLIAFKEQR